MGNISSPWATSAQMVMGAIQEQAEKDMGELQ